MGGPVSKRPIRGTKSSATTQSTTPTTKGEVAAASGFLKTSQSQFVYRIFSHLALHRNCDRNCETTRNEIQRWNRTADLILLRQRISLNHRGKHRPTRTPLAGLPISHNRVLKQPALLQMRIPITLPRGRESDVEQPAMSGLRLSPPPTLRGAVFTFISAANPRHFECSVSPLQH